MPVDTCNSALGLACDIVCRKAGCCQFIERSFLVIHNLVVEILEVLGLGIVENGVAQLAHVLGHAGTGSIVVSRGLEEICEVSSLHVVFLGPIERAECHALHEVKSERLLRRNCFAGSIQLCLDFLEAIGPERLPTENFGILEQQSPEGDKVAIDRPFILGSSMVELHELMVSGLRSLYRDAALSGPRATKLAEAADVAASAHYILKRTHEIGR